jgi:hypothetical protein
MPGITREHAALVDVADIAAPRSAFDVHLLQHAVLDHATRVSRGVTLIRISSDSPRLLARHPTDVVQRGFAGSALLRHLDLDHAEIEAELFQQLAAAG